ncbi:lipoprotein signal peptidase [Thermaurantimonas aggregans]|uniref:Lipoprotein signal peptidase n=1 Tax=Thermaurantimonas aggregans TaxID=2173829 RepID=A0A401XL74_9FLAO|nr:lipoprotein signal peptidase [Thermaurantimonas aggregans]MCX8148155.1 lipoprotein signal peptidase [Thermaurantimonas aggregans]GCD77777.1 lipoprotein signal peptidase [Thermaurantimonas aggregans]
MKKNLLIVGLVILADQVLKIWIKLNLSLGQEIKIADWFILHFTENPGMAFGIEWGGNFGKYLLTIFRIIAVIWIFTWLVKLTRQKAHLTAQVSISLVLAGALGNLIDSLFYGIIFSDSYHQVAHFLPEQGGYAAFMLGHVVDMFYFPLFTVHLPEWLPLWGGESFIFFQPVFNIADASITIGVIFMILFQKHLFQKEIHQSETVANSTT